jgi:hypothetical protein
MCYHKLSFFLQIQDYSVNLCGSRTVVHISNSKSYGTLTSVEFDYEQQQVRLLFSKGANCTSTGKGYLLVCFSLCCMVNAIIPFSVAVVISMCDCQ